MYKYFGIDIKNQKIDDEQVPRNLKELLEKNPELWERITDIKFDDGTKLHQEHGNFENAPQLKLSFSNEKLFDHYAIQFNDNPDKKDDKFHSSCISFTNGKLNSIKSDYINNFYQPAIILQNQDMKKSVYGMSYFWYQNGNRTLNTINKYPYKIVQGYNNQKERVVEKIVFYKKLYQPLYYGEEKEKIINYFPAFINVEYDKSQNYFKNLMDVIGVTNNYHYTDNQNLKIHTCKTIINNIIKGYILEEYTKDKPEKKVIKYYNDKNELHRIDGPAYYEQDNKNDGYFNLKYYIDGKVINKIEDTANMDLHNSYHYEKLKSKNSELKKEIDFQEKAKDILFKKNIKLSKDKNNLINNVKKIYKITEKLSLLEDENIILRIEKNELIYENNNK